MRLGELEFEVCTLPWGEITVLGAGSLEFNFLLSQQLFVWWISRHPCTYRQKDCLHNSGAGDLCLFCNQQKLKGLVWNILWGSQTLTLLPLTVSTPLLSKRSSCHHVLRVWEFFFNNSNRTAAFVQIDFFKSVSLEPGFLPHVTLEKKGSKYKSYRKVSYFWWNCPGEYFKNSSRRRFHFFSSQCCKRA